MPYDSIAQAKAAGFPTSKSGIPLMLSQINRLSKFYDAIKKAGTAKVPMAVAWTQWEKEYKIENGKWVKVDSKADKRNDYVNFVDQQFVRDFSPFSIDSEIIDETNKYVTFNVQLTHHGIMNGGYQSEDETKALIPFSNGLPIIIDHPDFSIDDFRSIVIMDRRTVKGFTAEMEEANVKNNLVVKGVGHIFEQFDEVINNIKNKKFINSSMGSYLLPISQDGNFNGEKYNHLRTNIMPFHNALLTKARPACAPPFCGVNLNEKIEPIQKNNQLKGNSLNQKVYIPKNQFTINIETLKGAKMLNSKDSGNEEQIVRQTQKFMSLEDVNLESLKENKEVQKLIDSSKKAIESLDKLQKEFDESKKQIKELTPYKEEIEKKATEELKKKKETLLKTKIFEKELIDKMCVEEVDNHILMAEKITGSKNNMIFPPLKNVTSDPSKEYAGPGYDHEKNEWKKPEGGD